jgi:hypothetical protein
MAAGQSNFCARSAGGLSRRMHLKISDLDRHSARRKLALAFALALLTAISPALAMAWGNEGHRITGLIADHFLDPRVRSIVRAILAADNSGLTARSIADEATWADKYRDSDRSGSREHYFATREWHFVNIELHDSDLSEACYGHSHLLAGIPASRGPARACIVDKIDQFATELANPATDAAERLFALQFLLHLVGDIHQPLHAADDHDAGGNRKRISAGGLGAANLHELFDLELVEHLATDPLDVAAYLISQISDEQRREWSRGTAADWAMESFAVARDHVYGRLPAPSADGSYVLTRTYTDTETRDVAAQLSKAGVRLALVLNTALGGEQPKR